MAKLLPAVLVIVAVVAVSAGYFVFSLNPGGSQTSSSTSSQTSSTTSQTSTTTSSASSTTTRTTPPTTTRSTPAEYVVREYVPGEYSGTKSLLIYGEIDYTLRYTYTLHNTNLFRIRTWDNSEGTEYSPGTFSTANGHEYIGWYGTGTAYVSKSGTKQAMLYNDSQGSFVDESFGWLGSRSCQGRLFIDTEYDLIKNAAEEIRARGGSPFQTASDIADWMLERVTYSGPDVPFSKTPVDVLETGDGECAELSLLYASLCRAAGIPARLVHGDFFIGSDEITGHFWAEFYDSGNWIPVDMTCMVRYHSGPMQRDFGPASDWFGYFDSRDIPRWVEDASESSMEQLYSDTYQFNTGFGIDPGITHSEKASMEVQMGARLLIYNTGRRELVFDVVPPT